MAVKHHNVDSFQVNYCFPFMSYKLTSESHSPHGTIEIFEQASQTSQVQTDKGYGNNRFTKRDAKHGGLWQLIVDWPNKMYRKKVK